MAQDSGLREMFLNSSEKELGIELPATTWLVVMETGIEGGSYTVLAVYDGTTSIYFSNGGGIIGAGEYPEVSAKSKAIVESSSSYKSHFAPILQAKDRPDKGRTVFYLRTASKLSYSEGLEETFGSGEHPLSPLFFELHELITAVRQNSPQNDD